SYLYANYLQYGVSLSFVHQGGVGGDEVGPPTNQQLLNCEIKNVRACFTFNEIEKKPHSAISLADYNEPTNQKAKRMTKKGYQSALLRWRGDQRLNSHHRITGDSPALNLSRNPHLSGYKPIAIYNVDADPREKDKSSCIVRKDRRKQYLRDTEQS
ncbi:hypothetical protein SFRURICE_005683, partial [Spodoptera frugiperda]